MNIQLREILTRKHGFSLIEISIAMLILGCILTAFWLTMGSGMRGFYNGTSRVTALQDALVLMEMLEADIDNMVIPPSMRNTPLEGVVEETYLKFAVPDFGKKDPTKLSLLDKIPTKWVTYSWVKEDNRQGIAHLKRNNKVYKNIDILSARWSMTKGDNDSDSMCFLEIRMKIGGVFERKPFVLYRKKELVAASMSIRYSKQYSQVIDFIEEPSESWKDPRL